MATSKYWAKTNPWKARFTIISARVIMGLIAFVAGLLLTEQAHFLSPVLLRGAFVLFLFALLVYPAGRVSKGNYARRNFGGGLAMLSSFVFYMGLGNMSEVPALSTAMPTGTVAMASVERPASVAVKHHKWEWPQKMQHKIQRMGQGIKAAAGRLSAGAIILLSLASLIIVVGLGYVVAALSCSLSCNGNEGAAVALLIGGLALIALIVVLMWRWAVRKARGKTKKESTK